MQIKKCCSFLLPVLLITTLSACYSPQIPLSKAEEALSESLAEKYGCEVTMSHDYSAITENTREGMFYVHLNDTTASFCHKDSIEIVSMAKYIAGKLQKILTHKQNYALIATIFTSEKPIGKHGSTTLCDTQVEIQIADLEHIQFIPNIRLDTTTRRKFSNEPFEHW